MTKTYGDFARQDIRHHHSRMRKGVGTFEHLAQRIYYMQMEIYSSYAGRDLDQPWDSLSDQVRTDWIKSAKRHHYRQIAKRRRRRLTSKSKSR